MESYVQQTVSNILNWWMTESKWADEVQAATPASSFHEFISNNGLYEFFQDLMYSDDIAELSDDIRSVSNGQIDDDEIQTSIEIALDRAYNLTLTT